MLMQEGGCKKATLSSQISLCHNEFQIPLCPSHSGEEAVFPPPHLSPLIKDVFKKEGLCLELLCPVDRREPDAFPGTRWPPAMVPPPLSKRPGAQWLALF